MWKKVKAVTDFINFGSKNTPDGDCSHEIQTLVPWKESCDKFIKCIKKQQHHFATEIHIAKAIVFPVVIYGCES